MILETKSQMILMIQNLGSKPNINCNTTTEVVMTMGLLYLMNSAFMVLTAASTRFTGLSS